MIRISMLSALIALAPSTFAQSPGNGGTADTTVPRERNMSGFVHAAKVYPFSRGALYRLYTAPGRISDIALQRGETLISVASGDTARWTVGDTTSGSGETRRTHILVKPFSSGLSTNMIITTDRRVYRLRLASRAGSATPAISWTYPADELIAWQRGRAAEEAARPVSAGVEIERLNFDYRISGDRPPWTPRRAFDDGRRTWIEFPPSIAVGEAPPLFVLGDDGEAELVNYRMSGRYYVVDRIFGAAELRLGTKKQKIVRITRRGKHEADQGARK